ncbi:MAG: hypothetical protein ABJN40_11180 [Sneathiella sp.]
MSLSATPLLKYTLLTNAATSAITGLLCLVANGFLTDLMGLASTIYLYIVGAGLLVFAADVYFTATKSPIKPLFVKMIIGADISWVVGSFLLTFLMPEYFTLTGIVLIEVIALGVLGFAVLQSVGLKQTTQNAEVMA